MRTPPTSPSSALLLIVLAHAPLYLTGTPPAPSLADEVVVLDVYGAREAPLPGITGERIAEKVTASAHYVPSQADVAGVVAGLAGPGDVVITMGAGDVTMQGPAILNTLARRGAEAGA